MKRKDPELDARAAWVQLSGRGERPDRVELLRASRDTSVFRLTICDVGVIAKRCRLTTGSIERIVYEKFLANSDVSSPHYYGSVPDTEKDYCWLFVEEIHGEPYRPERAEHKAAAARWLAGFHGSCSGDSEQTCLPERSPAHYKNVLESVRGSLFRHEHSRSETDNATYAAVRAHCDALQGCWSELEAACACGPNVLVHGDLIAHNAYLVRRRDDIEFIPFDWEKAGWGTPAEDLAHVDLTVYRETLGHHRPGHDSSATPRIAGAGRIFRCLVYLEWLRPDLARGTDSALEQLAQCRSWLDSLMERKPWLN
jgi:hypothetical protein